ncbi:MAG TPA: hypothetical protein VGQ44_21020 [Gemmatimonadaceae bacterium]|nr:hypothetical protein [Gemmatimonadaceae bacterium]
MTANALALPDIATATLPATYERAKEALATCERIDECKDWADRAAALASYAKQADDDTLHRLATRISSRAIRRAGELLKTFQSAGGRPPKTTNGADGSYSQRKAADDAGMSERQELTAVRVANVPADEFEALVESDNPPTVTALAERGKTPGAAVPEKFKAATHLLGICRELKLFAGEHDAALVADAICDHEAVSIREAVAVAGPWLEHLLVRLQEKYPC